MTLPLSDFGTDDYAYLRELHDFGDLSVCVAIIGDDLGDDRYFILLLRCLLRMGRWHEAIRPDMLERAEKVEEPYRSEAYAVLGAGYHRAGNLDAAEEFLREAKRLAGTENDHSWVAYYSFLVRWSRHDFDGAEQFANSLAGNPKFDMLRFEQLAWIAAGRGDLRAQVAFLRQALSCDGDAWIRSHVIWSLSCLAFELYLPEVIPEIEEAAKNLHWKTDMFKQEFYTFLFLGLTSALQGQMFEAFERFVHAEQATQRTDHPAARALLVRCLSNKAFLAIVHDDMETARRNVINAAEQSKCVDWAAPDCDRIALTALAHVAARSECLDIADEAWSRYRSIQTPVTPLQAFGIGDQRRVAIENFTAGHIHAAHGERDRAIAALAEAFSFWEKIDYKPRSVMAAIPLAQLTGESFYFDYATKVTDDHFPRAWFAKFLAPYRHLDPILKSLSESKRVIVHGLFEGMKYREIAELLGVTEVTIRKHVQDLYDHFEPEQRTARGLCSRLRSLGVDNG